MTDQATPNLPSRDFDSTAAFYERLGFGIVFRDAGWMILQRGDLMLEFFAHRARSPRELVQLLPEAGRPRGVLPAVQIRRHPGNQQRLSAHPCPRTAGVGRHDGRFGPDLCEGTLLLWCDIIGQTTYRDLKL